MYQEIQNMQQPNKSGRIGILLTVSICLGLLAIPALTGGCLNVGGNEPLVRVGDGSPPPVDTSQVHVSNLDDARQQLAEAHARINYLEKQNSKLQRDKEELKAELKQTKSERNMYKDRYQKAIGKD
jgi:septal ring factor EnvC (AmiA/AmiB activator)